MRIALFLGSAGSNSGGPERHDIELVRSLTALDHDSDYLVVCLFPEGPARVGVQQENVSYEVLAPPIRTVSMLTSLPWAMWRRPVDLWHATYVPPPIAPKEYIFTLVCSSMFEMPELYPPAIRVRLVALMRRAVAKARYIICISDHIRQVLIERFGVSNDRLGVIHLGVSEAFRPFAKADCSEFVREHYAIEHPYFLFSGRWEPRKNIVRILEAFAAFKRETGSEVKMVFSGERTWAAHEADAVIHRNGLAAEVIDLGKSPVDELPILYSGAEALVYPSLWEGFGLPIVEGMAAGIPVITSNNSSMAEVSADAALLVDPLSVEDIAEAMIRITADATLATTMREKGLRRAMDFTWRHTAQQTLETYQRLIML